MNKRVALILTSGTILLSVPLIAKQFTEEVNWSLRDFAIMGVLLFGTGILIELILRKVKDLKFRFIIGGAVLLISFLIWAELAVGIFGTPFAGS
ncbi:MAG: hypothetical protein EP305_03115 [Bacteroidetes bacterium]|nr:MAG: hypothetical protein EP305_03115 [Bacteroidota bacterium]